MNCRTCRHWLPTDTEGAGECHQQSPPPMTVQPVVNREIRLVVVWPSMPDTGSCGQWTEKPKAVVDVAAVTRRK